MPKLGDITNVWNTIREINVGDIHTEAEQRITLALVGTSDARAPVADVLRGEPSRASGVSTYINALIEIDILSLRDRQPDLHDATMIIVAIDGRQPVTSEIEQAIDRLSFLPVHVVVICLGVDRLPQTDAGRVINPGKTQVIFVTDASSQSLSRTLPSALIEHIPDELRLASARRIPGLRESITRELVNDTSFTNASYALTSGIPELIPVLNIPLNAADTLVLTKNQALMVYKIGLAYGAPGDFQAQMREILPVIGGGFVWRQVARQLIGLIPGFGLLPKVAVAYAGTYATGQAAAVWYSRGEVLSRTALQGLYRDAMEVGRKRATELIRRKRDTEEPFTTNDGHKYGRFARIRRGLRNLWPFRRTSPPKGAESIIEGEATPVKREPQT